MRLIHPDYQIEIDIEENQVTILTIENPGVFSDFLQDLWNGTKGEEAKVHFEDEGKRKKMDKEVECIFNPFNLDLNDKRILNKVYQELKGYADDFLIEEMCELNGRIIIFLDKLIQTVPYSLTYTLELNLIDLCKAYQIKVEGTKGTVLEQIVQYMEVGSQICGIDIFVFVGLKSYLSEEELSQLYEFVFYKKIYLIIVESNHTSCLYGENGWILDKDLCIIKL